MKTAPNRPTGDLSRRLTRNYDRLERNDYRPDAIWASAQNAEWPGDLPGREIMALSHLARVTGRAPVFLEELVNGLPARLNARGYLGEIADGIDEQQLSGHGWLVAGLWDYHALSGDARVAEWAVRMADGLYLPLRGRFPTYPGRPEDRVIGGGVGGNRANVVGDWTLSTDIGCAFIGLEGIVATYLATGRDDLRTLIEEAFDAFRALDLVGVSAQLHASLTAARRFLAFHDRSGASELVAEAERVYGLFKAQAITENYANWNWFGRPTWTEPCAIVDAFVVASELWRKTGRAAYLHDAHDIFFNGLGYGQKPHGGFGCDTCLGAGESPRTLRTIFFDVHGCCNMRGAVGLAAAADYAALADDAAASLPFLFDGTYTAGPLSFTVATDYPRGGSVRVSVTEAADAPAALRLYVPEWATAGATLTVNGHPEAVSPDADGLTTVASRAWKAGDAVELRFPVGLRRVAAINPAAPPDAFTYRHGPLILGRSAVLEVSAPASPSAVGGEDPAVYAATVAADVALRPLYDALDLPAAVAKDEPRQALFA